MKKVDFWHGMDERPDRECTCHVLIRYENQDQGRIEYSTEPDTYAIELAREFGHEPGFCKDDRWPERESLKAWHHFPELTEGLREAVRNRQTPYRESGYEWHLVPEDPTEEGWYHILYQRLQGRRAGTYGIRQDLYAIDIAKAHNHPVGFTAARIPDQLTVLAWCKFPAVPARLVKDRTKPVYTGYRKAGWSEKH